MRYVSDHHVTPVAPPSATALPGSLLTSSTPTGSSLGAGLIRHPSCPAQPPVVGLVAPASSPAPAWVREPVGPYRPARAAARIAIRQPRTAISSVLLITQAMHGVSHGETSAARLFLAAYALLTLPVIFCLHVIIWILSTPQRLTFAVFALLALSYASALAQAHPTH
jgi:hypothetical protein